MILSFLVTGAAMWAIAYFIIIVRSFRRATYGMPLIPICFNLSWDFTFAFLMDPCLLSDVSNPFYDPGKMDALIHRFCTVWAAADLIMLYQVARYGKGDTVRHARQGYFYVYAVALVLLGFCFIYLSRYVFQTPRVHFLMCGMLITMLLSVSYLAMALSRVNLRGQSLSAALLRLVGIQFICFSLIDALPAPMMLMFISMFLVIDCMYIILLGRWCRRENASILSQL